MSALARTIGHWPVMLLLCLAVGASLSIWLGQDISWDLKNYHLYNAWAFIHGRSSLDLAAASLQSYFNPLPDLPYYWLATGPLHTWPRLLAGYQGLWYGLLLFVVIRIAGRYAQLQGGRLGMAEVCAALIGATGTMAISQTGSTSNEVQLAVLVLTGLYLLLPLLGPTSVTKPKARALCAGVACGVAAGLKPTAAIYLPAMALALLFALNVRRREAWQATASYTAGATLAILLVYGPWGSHLYQATGNPLFPLFNQWFHSPLTTPTPLTDSRFFPRNVAQWLFYPFFWLKRRPSLVTEVPFADPRYAMAMLSLVALATAYHMRGREDDGTPNPALRFLVIFVSASYLTWLVRFAILRYAVALESLTGLVMLIAVRTWMPASADHHRLGKLFAVLLVLIIGASAYPNWWRAPYSNGVIEAELPNLEPNSIVILAGIPDGYLAALFPHAENLQFIGLSWFTAASRGYGLYEMTQRRLHEHRGPTYVVLRDDSETAVAMSLLQDILPTRQITACQPILSNMETGRRNRNYAMGLRLCRLADS